MQNYWQNRVAVITGATHGIGLRLAQRLAEKGVCIATIYRSNDAQAKVLADQLPTDSLILKGDITDGESAQRLIRETLDHWGKIDFLICNIGTDIWGNIADLTDKQWLRSQEITLNAPFRLIRQCLPAMRAQRFGRIVTLGASSREYRKGQAGLAPFGVHKAALQVLTQTVALEEIAHGITANMVAPGSTADSGVNPEEKRIPLSAIPIGRRMTTDEVTEAILYFLSPNAGVVTGQFIGVNGGCSVP
jgi:3-oxoacyl-[acyl-carrier protein] reductase